MELFKKGGTATNKREWPSRPQLNGHFSRASVLVFALLAAITKAPTAREIAVLFSCTTVYDLCELYANFSESIYVEFLSNL